MDIQLQYLHMDKQEVEKLLQWQENNKIFNRKYSDQIKMMVLYQEQLKIFGILFIYSFNIDILGNILNRKTKDFQLNHHLHKSIINKSKIYLIHLQGFYIVDGTQLMDSLSKI
jgi:hypothetical protein